MSILFIFLISPTLFQHRLLRSAMVGKLKFVFRIGTYQLCQAKPRLLNWAPGSQSQLYYWLGLLSELSVPLFSQFLSWHSNSTYNLYIIIQHNQIMSFFKTSTMPFYAFLSTALLIKKVRIYRFWSQTVWVQILTPSLNSCINLGKFLKSSPNLSFLFFKMRIVKYLLGCCKD